jgi:Na+/H+ antiporter NhaC
MNALSLLPIVVAIVLALRTKHILLSLGMGAFVAALLLQGGHPWRALVTLVDPMLLDSAADRDNMKVIFFSLFIAGTVEVLRGAGGTAALVAAVTRKARTRRDGMVATWFAGMIVFFDDYANCLVVGSAMRDVTDRLRISREKLAYLVDSTAAPMATVALVSTWIGYEVGLMDEALVAAGREENAYAFFMQGLPYRFYPLLALGFAGMVAFSGRDFGPMLQAEARAAGDAPADDDGLPLPDRPPARLLLLAALPIAALVGVTGASIWAQGSAAVGPGAAIFEIVGAADGYDAMLHGSTAALTLALGLGMLWSDQGGAVMRHALRGMTEIFEPLCVLLLAWALSGAVNDLGAADYLVGMLGESLPAMALPTVVFVLGAGIAFATGTSFGTMAVLMPLVIPLSFAISSDMHIALASSAAVLSGAVWGDHCSPVSDTTVLSSTGAGCDHAAHVTTQLPYALTVGAVAVLTGTLPAGMGVPPAVSLLLGLAACAIILRWKGRTPSAA